MALGRSNQIILGVLFILGIASLMSVTDFESSELEKDRQRQSVELQRAREEVVAVAQQLNLSQKEHKAQLARLNYQYEHLQQELGQCKKSKQEIEQQFEKSKQDVDLQHEKSEQEVDIQFEKTQQEEVEPDSTKCTEEFQRFTNLINTSKVLSKDATKYALLSETLYRNSRPIIGNLERLRIFIQKLLNKKCTNLLFVGGSVTHATRGIDGSYHTAYHSDFVKYLNERWPCEGGMHTLNVHGPGGTDAAYAAYNFNQLFRGVEGNIDFLTFEYAVNDASAAPLPEHTVAETVQMNTEILMRKALLYRNEDGSAPAIVYLETSFWARNVLKSEMRSPKDSVHVFTAGIHFPILTYYEIPTISAAQVWFGRFARFGKETWEDLESPWRAIFQDKCHPTADGHLAISQMMAVNLETEVKWFLNGPKPTELERDISLQEPPALPQPWWFTEAEENELVHTPSHEFNFQSQTPDMKSLLFNTGWKVFADSKEKFGLIATRSASHVAIEISMIDFDASSPLLSSGGSSDDFSGSKKKYAAAAGAHVNKVFLGHLRTYQNISDALVWLDDEPDGTGLCNELVVENPGACYLIGCNCDLARGFTKGPSAGYAILHMINKNRCLKNSEPPVPEEDQRLYDPVGVAPRDYNVQQISTMQRVHTSVYSHYEVAMSKKAIDAAAKGQAIYLHLCTLRKGELKLKYSNSKRRAEPVEGDAKFKLLVIGAKNGLINIKQESERKLGLRV